jgi:hypothetical protein
LLGIDLHIPAGLKKINNHDSHGDQPRSGLRIGIAYVPLGREIFSHLTVEKYPSKRPQAATIVFELPTQPNGVKLNDAPGQ